MKSFVGKVRLNEHVSDSVKKWFSKFPPTLDRIEIFDNSQPNDPSPPSKAAAIVHRSWLNSSAEGVRIPCMTVVGSKVFDYNNRDFQRVQLQSLMDSVADQWLVEQGGGVQLTTHRVESSGWRNGLSGKDVRVFAESRLHSSHSLFAVFSGKSHWLSLARRHRHDNHPTSTDPVASTAAVLTIDGSSAPSHNGVSLLDKDPLIRHAVGLSSEPPSADLDKQVQTFLKAEKCLHALVYSEFTGSDEPCANALVVTSRWVGMTRPSTLQDQRLILPSEFVV